MLFFSQNNDIQGRINSNKAIKELFPIEDSATIYLKIEIDNRMIQVED